MTVEGANATYKIRVVFQNNNPLVLAYETVAFNPRIPVYPVPSRFDTKPVMLCDP
jgi:hypothetical protein